MGQIVESIEKLSNKELQEYYNNAMNTYYSCGGHHKADINKGAANEYLMEAKERGVSIIKYDPDADEGRFNGIGAY